MQDIRGGGRNAQGGLVSDFMAQHGKGLDPKLPFFYVQHPHLKDTCYGPWARGHDAGLVTQTLSAYPNAVTFVVTPVNSLGQRGQPLTASRG